jgi:hypothetical protein
MLHVIRIIEADIDHCYMVCPFFASENHLMRCNHPEAPAEDIISQPTCLDSFPKECPLLNKEKQV